MSVSQPSEDFPVRWKSGSTMMPPLHSAGENNGNAFPVSSSSSASSSCCCLGESSPESLRSLSSLSGSRIDSPLDYDMFEVTLMTTVMTKMDKMKDVVISAWVPEEERKVDNNGDGSVGKIQTATVLTESNDNSVSVYLDANSAQYHQDTWNDNDNLTMSLSQTTNSSSHGKNDDFRSGSGNERRHGCSTPNSDTTEIPAADNDEDDEEKSVFLSVSSVVGVGRSSMTLTSSIRQSSDSLINPGSSAVTTELQTVLSVADDVRSEVVLDRPEVACPLGLPVESQTVHAAAEDFSKTTQEVTSPPPEEVGPKPHTSQPARASKTKSATATSTAHKTVVLTAGKPSNLEAKRVSKLDPKNIKVKVGSRPNHSPPIQQNKSAPANGKRAVPRREEAQTGHQSKKQRSSASPVKVAMVAIRGKSSKLKTNHKTSANDSAQPEKRSLAVSRTISTSTSSLGSEVVEKGPTDSPRNYVQDVPEKHETPEGVETPHPCEDAYEESVEDQMEGTGTALITEATVDEPRNPVKKVSSKLGPNTRQQRRGIRLDKGTSGLAPTTGSGTRLPGQGSSGPRQTQSDGSTLREDGQSPGGGSPTRMRQSQTQCQGIPRPRTATERAFTLAALSPATSNSKPTANQQPALGSVGRPTPPTASKLPVKGLPTSLSSSALGNIENNGATSKASLAFPGAPALTGTKPDEQFNRSTLPVGSQSTAKPFISSTASTTTTTSVLSDVVTSVNSGGVTAAPKPAMRSRALSLQARTTAASLKTLTVANHNTAKAATNQTTANTAPTANHLAKKTSQYLLQRSGSARLNRPHSTVWAQQLCMTAWQTPVDKNKPWEAPGKPTNTNSNPQGSAHAGGNNQNQQQPPPDLVPDVPASATDTTNTGSGTTGSSGLGFKARTGSRSTTKTGFRLQNAPKPGGAEAVVADRTVITKQNQSKEQAEKKNQVISQLRKLLIQGNKRVEALATVIQHLFTECEEAVKQKKEFSLELAHLRDELVTSSQCCKHLQKEKKEMCVSMEETLKRLEEQHKEELVQLEKRLRSFYQTEWDKVHQTYQEEADKCRMLMEQQVEELRSQQEAERKNQEVNHSQKMECLKLHYETSIQELKRIQQTDLESLEKTLKETETSLSEKVCELSAEKEALNEKLKAEEERRKHILSDKNLKDSHTVYLEQELESLKVVLEIKNNQLHQKEKKLMEMDKLVEMNVKLEECLTKVQQENEDYKARMDKQAALSKQLSNEQAKLQQTLQKESKVNKRLSMENEELLWKLHNGDLLASPRRLSPTSPFSSPRNSASFPTTEPLSPR